MDSSLSNIDLRQCLLGTWIRMNLKNDRDYSLLANSSFPLLDLFLNLRGCR